MRSLCLAPVALLFGLAPAVLAQPAQDFSGMQFNDVKEVAPGVFFRYSAISPTKPAIFGGSNNVWVVFDDYVVVIDANFPKEAADVIAAVKKTTDKPIRYVFDTHQHGDHSWGNGVFARIGAGVIAQANCARHLRTFGADEFRKGGEGPTGRKDVAGGTFKAPNIVFDDKLVLDDGKQRIEFLFLGHAHTAGDAVAYLPKHKILCTGDACLNGPYNYLGDSDTASWVRVLERMQQLDVALVCPGHGLPAGKELVEKQKRYFVELRRQVAKGVADGKDADDITKGISMPWYKEWTTVEPPPQNTKYVYDELTGRVAPWDLSEEFGIYPGPSPTKNSPGWKKPQRIVVPDLMPARLAELKRVAPEVEFVPARDDEEAAKVVAEADAVVGIAAPLVLRAGKKLRWIQLRQAPEDAALLSELATRKVALTDSQRVFGPSVADQAFALLLALTRGRQDDGRDPQGPPPELYGKTMLVVGLNGAGEQTARRARAFGMRVLAVDDRTKERPEGVFHLARPDRLAELLPRADVVVLAAPLAARHRILIGKEQLARLKPSAYLVKVAPGGLVELPALVAALKDKRLAGAGIDLGPTPLTANHPLRAAPNVVFGHRRAQWSPDDTLRLWRLWRENVRRFAAGEPLLCVVETTTSVGNAEAKLPLLLQDDFEQGAARWQPTDPAAWKVIDTPRGKVYSQSKQSAYKPPHRSPFNFSLVKDVSVSDFVLTAKLQSTVKDYGHRDMCLVFGYQDPAHFYYVHLGKKTDEHANQIFIVNGAPRTKVSTKTTSGTPWDDEWHTVKIVRKVADGSIAVYFDDMDTPAMTATDRTFTWGRVGVGSFDDTGNWDDIRLYGHRAGKP